MFLIFYRVLMRVIEKIEMSKLKYGCVVVTQNFLFNYSLLKIILNPSKKVEFSSENQKDMSVDGSCFAFRSCETGSFPFRARTREKRSSAVQLYPKVSLNCRWLRLFPG